MSSRPLEHTLPKFRAVLFDMDGVLLDSEPFWRIAQIESFQKRGQIFSDQDCQETMGMRIDEVVSLRLPDCPREEVVEEIVTRVEQLVRLEGKPLPGVISTLNRLRQLGVPCGLATSSRYRLIEVVLSCLGLHSHFSVLHSAEVEPYGKPHPGVYLNAAEKLGFQPEDCLAIEDSVRGMIAAKAAQMTVIVTPEAANLDDPRFHLADLKVERLDHALPLIESAWSAI